MVCLDKLFQQWINCLGKVGMLMYSMSVLQEGNSIILLGNSCKRKIHDLRMVSFFSEKISANGKTFNSFFIKLRDAL